MVTELIKENQNYSSGFAAIREASPTLPWVELVRNSAMERFETLGFPSVHEEDWKYTNLAPLRKSDFKPLLGRSDEPVVNFDEVEFSETTGSTIVLVNGFFRADLSQLESLDQVVALDLLRAVEDARFSKIVREYLARNATYHENGLTALNTAFLQSGLFLLIPKNVTAGAPIQIVHLSDAAQSNTATFPRALIVAEQNSSATIIEIYRSTGAANYFCNAVGEIVLLDGARIKHHRLQEESAEAIHVSTTAAELGRNSSYDLTSITLGGRLSRHDIQVVMDHEGSECWVDGLYIVGQDQHADTHSLIDHRKPHCVSRQLYKGILDGNGHAVFNGKVFVRHGAEKTDAMQTNKNLLLSDNARVDTKPQLEIYADDVKCAHGAAIGQINKDELFYLTTRGINPDLGQRLLTFGFAEQVIEKIEIESVRTHVDQAVVTKLKTRLED